MAFAETIPIPINDTSSQQFPYKLFKNHTDLSVQYNKSSCFFFHLISYSIFSFSSESSKPGNNNISCLFNNLTNITTLRISPDITLNLLITYSEVVKSFWIQGVKEEDTSTIVYLTFDTLSKVLNISERKIPNPNATIIYSNLTFDETSFYFHHFIFKNLFMKEASLFGYLYILIGLFIAASGSLFHRTTVVFEAIFLLIGVINELLEPLLPSYLFTESLALLIVCGMALVGIFIGWLILLNKSIEKIFYGVMLGLVLFKPVTYLFLMIYSTGFAGEQFLFLFFWLVFAVLFGFLYYKIHNNQLSFIISTCIVGSFMIVYGYNLFLGGYLEDSLVFSIRKRSREDDCVNNGDAKCQIYSQFYDKWKNVFVLMYLCVWLVSIVFFFLIQIMLRYRREMVKPISEQRGLFRSMKEKRPTEKKKTEATPLKDTEESQSSETKTKKNTQEEEEDEDEEEEDEEEEEKYNDTYN